MERGELKTIGSKIIEGSFDELLEVLNERPDCLLTKQALYLIVCCCTTCNTNINSCNKLNEQKLIPAVVGLSKVITKVTTEEYDSYLQSIFFICKLLMKKNYELLLEVEAEILPKFIPTDLTEKQKGVYRSICDLIRNVVMNVTLKNVEVDKKKIILLGNLLSKIIIISLNHSIFLDYVFTYGACLPHMNIDLNVQHHYLLENITVMKDLSIESILNGIPQLIKYSMHVFSSYLKHGNLDMAQQCIDDTLNMIPKEGEWEYLKEMLNIGRYIIDPSIDKNKLVTSKDCLIKASKLYRKSENFLITYKLLSHTMITYSNYCKNYDVQKIFVDPEKHIILYKILSVMTEILLLPFESCKKGCKCLSKNSFEGSDAILCILILFSSLLSTNVAKDYTKEVTNHLKKYFKLLVQRRQYKCEMYKKCWSDAAPYLYNVGVLLLRKERFEEALSFGNMTLKYHSLLGENVENAVLSSTFNLMNSAYCKQKRYKEALIWSAIEIINTNKSCRNKIFYKWIKIKADCRDEIELQEFNILSIINIIPTEFIGYINHAKSLEDQIDLLVSELENYYVKWKSKLPMMSAFKKLCQIADKSIVFKVFVRVFTDEDTIVHEDVPKLLNDVFKDFENCQENLDGTLKLYLSFYMFFQYKHQTKELISKNLEEMDKVTKPKNGTDIDVMPADAFDRCDTVSVYENLNVNSEKMRSLVKSITLLEEIILPGINQSMFTEIEPRKVYELTKNIAFEFILHSDGINTLKSLFLAFSLAQLLNDKDLLLECSGYLMRHLNYSELEKEMEKTTSYLKDSSQSYKVLLEYYMNLSYFHISVKNIELAYKHYESAKKYRGYLVGKNEKSLWCIEVGMELLLFKLMEVAKSTQFDIKMKLSYGPLMKAYNMIIDKYTSGSSHWTTYSMIILLEIFDSLVKMYFDLKMPREVRCFGKQCLMLAQQHVIPVYSSRILNYLAYADLWGEKWDDCRVKLDGIADILELNKTERCTRVPNPKNRLTVPSVNDITEGIQEIMLDAPFQTAYNVKSSPASPVLQAQSYKCPFFMNHILCECFHCTSVDLQQIVLSYFHLEALWYMHKGQITLSDSFFKGVFKLHESLLDKRKDMSRVFHNYMSQHSEFYRYLPRKECAINFSLNEIKIYTSINYVRFLSSSGAHEAAKKVCESALKKFEMAKVHHPHLYGELLLQKLGLICALEVNTDVNNLQVESSTTNGSDFKIKTPESRVPNSNIRKMNSPRMKKLLPPKVIHFNLTDSSSTSTPSKKTNDMATPAKTPKVRVLPPSLRMINTPKLKPAKKSIFNDELKKSTPVVNRQNITYEHDEKQKSPLSEISDLQTMKSVQPTTDLEEKTKLLTSKLRKKQNSENSSRDNELVKEPVRRSRRNRT